jgi:hypothetical protein
MNSTERKETSGAQSSSAPSAAQALDLTTYPWPKVTGVDIVVPTANTDPKLLKEAERRGYSMYSGGNAKPGNKMFATLFYKGGKIIYREDVPKEHRENVHRYLRSFIGSWAPKHEHKHAICAMLLDEIATGVEESPKKEAK